MFRLNKYFSLAGTMYLIASTVLFQSPLFADETMEFDWLSAGRVIGYHNITIRENGTREVDFQVRERGRGPTTNEVTRFDDTGRITAIEIFGKAAMGGVVEEHFKRSGNGANWQSELENGQVETIGEAIYVASNGSTEQLAILARALLHSPGNSLALLPSGRATIEKVNQAQIGPPGRQRYVSLYAISGLDLTPDYLWLDENLELFARNVHWMAVMPKGWAEFLPQLQEKQKVSESSYFEKIATRLTFSLGTEYALININLVDVDHGELLGNRSVMVRNGKIASINLKLPEDFSGEIIDGKGAYLIPGMWDMHTHLGVDQGIQHIAAGVTTIRDVGNSAEDQQHIKSEFESGRVIGPSVIVVGFIDRKGPFSAPIGTPVETRAEALQKVRDFAAMGYPQIKIYSSIDPAWVKAIAKETHANGMRLSGHIPNGMNAREAVKKGFNEIHHINMLFLNFLANNKINTRSAVRVTLVAEQASAVDLDSRKVKHFIAFLNKKNVVVDPTVALFDGMLRHRKGQVNPSYVMIADHLPPAVYRQTLGSIMEITDENASAFAKSAEAMIKLVGKLHQFGVTIVAGTDATPGFLFHRELELYQQSGIPPADVIRIATLGAAEVMGMDGDIGSIAVGKRADMVLLIDNPLQNISAVRTARMVIKGEQMWRPSDLYRSMGIKPFVPDEN